MSNRSSAFQKGMFALLQMSFSPLSLRSAPGNAVRCDSRWSAFRWLLQCTAFSAAPQCVWGCCAVRWPMECLSLAIAVLFISLCSALRFPLLRSASGMECGALALLPCEGRRAKVGGSTGEGAWRGNRMGEAVGQGWIARERERACARQGSSLLEGVEVPWAGLDLRRRRKR